jgi:hypothetical protein
MKIEKIENSNQRLTIELFDISRKNYSFLSSLLAKKFNLIPSDNLIDSFDEIFQTFTDTNKKYNINLEWDNWSGYIIVANDTESEKLINKIYAWLLIEKLDF